MKTIILFIALFSISIYSQSGYGYDYGNNYGGISIAFTGSGMIQIGQTGVHSFGLSLDKTGINRVRSLITSVAAPIVITSAKSVIDFVSEGAGGNVTSDGGGTITARGLVWDYSTNPMPSVTSFKGKTIEPGTTGSFTNTMIELDTTHTFRYRAYATNSAGTSYGNDSTFAIRTNILIYDAYLSGDGTSINEDSQLANTLNYSGMWYCGGGVITSDAFSDMNNDNYTLQSNVDGVDITFSPSTVDQVHGDIAIVRQSFTIGTFSLASTNIPTCGIFDADHAPDDVQIDLRVIITKKVPYNP
jgi:hypothetical protein